jgi:predicted amidophosphoribosyltransferase
VRSEGLTTRSTVGPAQGAGRWLRETLIEPALNVLFPPRCAGCGDFETHLCARCRDMLVPAGPDSCPRCGEPGPVATLAGRCSHCMARTSSFAGARSAFLHETVARQLVAEFKFGGQPVLGRVMAELAGPTFRAFVDSLGPRDKVAVTWVPSHRSVERQRGYNQAAVLARNLAAEAGGIPCEAMVRKMAATSHQQRLDRAGRQANLRGAFLMVDGFRAPATAEAVVLVDDVYTTGATVGEVSSVLTAGSGLPVYVFTFSRARGGTGEGHD